MTKLEHQSALSRRAFLVGMAGTAVTFGFAPGQGTAEESGSSPFEPTIWYSLDRDGIVTVNIIRAEMGQHIGTAIARILADELEVDWSNVRISAGRYRSEMGLHADRRQQVGLARFPDLQPRRCRRPHRPDRGRRQAARREPVAMCRAPGRRVRRKVDPSPMAKSSGAASRHANLRRTNSRSCRSSRPRSDVSSGKRPMRSISRRRSTARRVTASMRSLKAWSMPGRRFLRHATARWSARSTIPRRSGSRDISRASCSRIPPRRCPVGSSYARRLIRRRSAPPTSSRSIGPRVMLRRCRSRTSSITAPGRSLHRAAERSWLTTRESIPRFAQPRPRSSGRTPPTASFMPSSSR